MKIIDAQIHIWGQGIPGHMHRQVPVFTAEEMLAEMDEAGVDAALIHPPCSWDPDANALSVEAARRYPTRFAVMGQFPLNRPQSPATIRGWRRQTGMMGLRWPLIAPEQQAWLRDGSLDWLWPAAEREGVAIATMGSLFLDDFRRIAEAHPGLKLILDHCGLVRMAQDEAAFARLDDLVALARLPNVAVKATGAPAYSSAPYPYRNIQDGLHRLFDAFGPQRFFWGTDITRMACSYRQCVTFFTEELPWLRGDELEAVMGRGLCAWIGWDYDFG
ncbi:amidohydrolase family protein [Roseococcus sp.]|uniref:amidohydrolase family protein n=1 Tax=Roseococcus sp. TaxID=2109646 RepID=UPI003BA9778A